VELMIPINSSFSNLVWVQCNTLNPCDSVTVRDKSKAPMNPNATENVHGICSVMNHDYSYNRPRSQ